MNLHGFKGLATETSMRFFTPDRLRQMNSKDRVVADTAEENWDDAVARYQDYLASQRGRLPEALVSLNLHDGQVEGIAIEGKPLVLNIRVRLRNRQVNIVYGGISHLSIEVDDTRMIHKIFPTDRLGDWMYDEIAVLDGGVLRHQIIFDSGAELSCEFKDFAASDSYDGSVSNGPSPTSFDEG